MNKILEGAKEAVKVAKCDHDLELLPRDSVSSAGALFDRYRCSKCMCVMWVPIKPHYARS